MSTRRHKRRRINVDIDLTAELSQEEVPSSPPYEPLNLEKVVDGAEAVPSEEALMEEMSAKERDIWDAFREEHYELLEQLPLSLHRAFSLIHELDQQAQEHISNLAPAILKYVSLRKALASVNKDPGPTAPTNGEGIDEPSNGPAENVEPQAPATNGKSVNGRSHSPQTITTPATTSTKGRTPSLGPRPLATVVRSSNSTRELLISMAQSIEEVSRASVEKRYLAQHVYDLVDRYVRDLDRAIKEQEASISLGLRPGTHPASIILPELIIPKPHRGRIVSSPSPIEHPEEELGVEILVEPQAEQPVLPTAEQPTQVQPEGEPEPEAEIEIVEVADTTGAAKASEFAPSRGRKKGRKRRKHAARVKPAPVAEEEMVEPFAEPEEEAVQAEQPPPLTLKIPAQAPAPLLPEEEIPPDPNEPRYCFCNQVSYGDMIACDNPTCTREWFHMGCVGLAKPPKGKWYCRECIEFVKRPKGKKRAR